jgi:hypothetical protein
MNEDNNSIPEMEFNHINQAFAEAQKEIKNPKKNQQGYGYKYAGLDQIEEMANNIFPKFGLSHHQDISSKFLDIGQVIYVQTIIRHSSGQRITSSKLPMLVEQGKGTSSNQSVGACITYARRYQLSAFLGIAAEEDTDLEGQQRKQLEEERKKAAADVKKEAAGMKKKAEAEKEKKRKESADKKHKATLIDRVKARLIDTGATAYAKSKNFDPDKASLAQLENFMEFTNEQIAEKVDAWEMQEAAEGSLVS